MAEASRASWTLLLGAMLGGAVLALVPSCLERREGEPEALDSSGCTTCHGDAKRGGDFLLRSAPPRDLLGASDLSYPGVGAHAIHLNASDTHGAFACTECHVVPARTDSPGHADDARPADLVFGPLARADGHSPDYDPVARTCRNSHCHGAADAVWTEPRSSEEACGSCHGLPPPAPHPQSDRCFVCHSDVIDDEKKFVAPELHVDGVTEVGSGACTLCHGGAGDSAPPLDTSGRADLTAIGVGAHRAHLEGGAFGRPLACSECHDVPNDADVAGHVGSLPAEVRLLGVAEAFGREPAWDRATRSCTASWCHGPGPHGRSESPSWVVARALDCTSCHDMPPPSPHPRFDDCSRCHEEVVDVDNVTIVDRAHHVDGIIDVTTDQSCTFCHGSENAAPPRDLLGSTSTRSPGVGAHQVHLQGTERSRAVPCGECHLVPERLLDVDHVDSAGPAEVSFSGAAVAFGGVASYSAGSCENTTCHGGVFPEGHRSGGTNTAPDWTRVNGTEAVCGSCHGLPPPAPHPRGDLNPTCSVCHENIEPDNLTFVRPELHVDGIVTFLLP